MNRKQFAIILVLIALLVAITGRCLATTVEANLTSLATIPVTAINRLDSCRSDPG